MGGAGGKRVGRQGTQGPPREPRAQDHMAEGGWEGPGAAGVGLLGTCPVSPQVAPVSLSSCKNCSDTITYTMIFFKESEYIYSESLEKGIV